MRVLKRREAKSLGLHRYYTGKQCSHGHTSERFTSSGYCTECYEKKKSNSPKSDEAMRSIFSYNHETGDVEHLVCGKWKLVRSIYDHKKSRTPYYRVNTGGKFYLAHRIAWFLHYGEWPNGQIDHVNGNGLDNRIVNLRCVSGKENIRNCRLSKNNTSGVNGVWVQGGRFVAEIMVNRKKISLGSYKNIDEAKEARRKAEIKYGFHNLHGSEK